MSSVCFVTQEATQDILLRVTKVCAECYNDITEGDTIHYDMQSYRYLCEHCQEELCEKLNDSCELMEEETPALF